MSIQQGFLSSEPFSAMQAGARPRVFLIADAGYDNYNCVIATSRRLVDERPEVLRRFVDASIEGWSQYMRGQDVAAANAAIMRDNPDMTQQRIDHAVRVMNENGIVMSGDAQTLGIGTMSDARWERFYNTMRDAGVYAPGLDVKRAYDLRFVNRRAGLS